jgi:large subunit ribosomal protein L21
VKAHAKENAARGSGCFIAANPFKVRRFSCGATGRDEIQSAKNRAERDVATMYAVIKTGGKQYRVAKDDVLTVEKLSADKDGKLELTEVLMIAGSGDPKLGDALSGAKVLAELVEHTRGPKVIAFKKRRRKNSRRKRGHRQDLTTIRITSIIGA